MRFSLAILIIAWNYNTNRNNMQENPFEKSFEFGIALK